MQIKNYNSPQINQQQHSKQVEKTNQIKKQTITNVEKSTKIETQKDIDLKERKQLPKQDIQSVLNSMQHQVKNQQVIKIQQQNSDKKVSKSSETSNHYEQ